VDVKTIVSCCEPVLDAALSEAQSTELARAFKVIADPVRLRLLSLVASAEAGEVCACDLVEPLGRSQPTVSHHLSVLTDAGLLMREQRGRWAWFRVDAQRLAVLRDALGGAALTPAG
jgi:ArsR family transcriptional regulator, arsenate/arsenite/antimonite-responsive transcriptional repressor